MGTEVAGLGRLPPLALNGLNTGLVESLDYYVIRQAVTCGVRRRTLLRAIDSRSPDRPKLAAPSMYFMNGPSPQTDERVRTLESWVGIDTLRHGSLWVLSDILGRRAAGRASQTRRWCPVCYCRWNSESYEPLIWFLEQLSLCPLHAVRLVHQCTTCGMEQSGDRDFALRRLCWTCNAALGWESPAVVPSVAERWADQKVLQIIEFCARVGRSKVPWSSFLEFLRGLSETYTAHSTVPLFAVPYIKAPVYRDGSRPTIRVIVNLLAIQGIDAEALFLRPKEASSAPLLNDWANFTSQPRTRTGLAPRATAAAQCLDHIYEASAATLPPMGFTLRHFRVNRDQLAELFPESYQRYAQRFVVDAKRVGPILIQRASRTALVMLQSRPKTEFWDLPTLAKDLAVAANISEIEALEILEATGRFCNAAAVHQPRLHELLPDTRQRDFGPRIRSGYRRKV